MHGINPAFIEVIVREGTVSLNEIAHPDAFLLRHETLKLNSAILKQKSLEEKEKRENVVKTAWFDRYAKGDCDGPVYATRGKYADEYALWRECKACHFVDQRRIEQETVLKQQRAENASHNRRAANLEALLQGAYDQGHLPAEDYFGHGRPDYPPHQGHYGHKLPQQRGSLPNQGHCDQGPPRPAVIPPHQGHYRMHHNNEGAHHNRSAMGTGSHIIRHTRSFMITGHHNTMVALLTNRLGHKETAMESMKASAVVITKHRTMGHGKTARDIMMAV